MTKRPVENAAKLVIRLLSPVSLSSTMKSDEFPLESMGNPAHVQLHHPEFSYMESSTWPAGVPMHFHAIETNTRLQVLKGANIKISVSTGGKEIFREALPSSKDINQKKTVIFPFAFTPPNVASYIIKATSSFMLETTRIEVTGVYKFTTTDGMSLVSNFQKNFVQLTFTNKTPFPAHNIAITDPSTKVADLLMPEETAAIIIQGAVQPMIQVRWSTNVEPVCFQNLRVQLPPSVPAQPLTVAVENLPRIHPALEPINVVLSLQNNQTTPVNGTISVNREENALLPYGIERFSLPTIQGRTTVRIQVTLVAVTPGFLKIPHFSIAIPGMQPFHVDPDDGILITGPATQQ